MKIQDFFDAGYYINLDKRVDRREHITSLFNSIGLGDFVERVSAEDGTHESVDKVRQHYCSASHKKVYELALERKHKRFVVFEDDFTLHNTDDYFGIDNIEAGLSQLKNIENWDIIHFGGYIIDDVIKKVDTNLLKVNNVLALHGYGVSDTALEKLLKHIPFADSALDGWVGHREHIIKYMIYPMSSYQADLSSDLDASGRTPPISHWTSNYINSNKIII
jgi:GR25 family glycosyltransferase involved in LPS biosynthesis